MPLRATVYVMLKHFICVFNVHTFFHMCLVIYLRYLLLVY